MKIENMHALLKRSIILFFLDFYVMQQVAWNKISEFEDNIRLQQ